MRNKGHTQLVRGGQTTQHWTRMATQVFKYSTSVAAAAFTITFLVLVAQNYEMDKVRLTGIYWIAEFNVEQRGTELRELNYVDLDGRRVKRTAGQIYADRGMRATYDLYTANAWRFLYFSLLPAAAAFSFTFAVFAQNTYPLLFLIPPVVVAHAFRLGSLGTAFSTIKVAVIALVMTETGRGPINLMDYSHASQLLVLEAFLASAIFVGLPVAAILATRKRITEELTERTEELSLLAENVTDAILRYDAQGVCTYASPSTRDVLGRPPEDFIGRTASERLHPDAREQIERVDESRAVRIGPTFEDETEQAAPSGEIAAP